LFDEQTYLNYITMEILERYTMAYTEFG
jgi:hypothetical protein